MAKIFYKPENAWVGDLIPFSDENHFYLDYLHDFRQGKDEDDYADRTDWNLLLSDDGITVKPQGVAIPHGGMEDCDLSCYTGSVIQGQDKRFHLFYTAQNNRNDKFIKDGRPVQLIMHATSTDLIRWEKHYDTAFGADDVIYEVFDWRDPFVFWQEEENCYYMLLAARKKGKTLKRGGCIALCKSDDLFHWKICEPFYAPDNYLTHECPDLFKIGDWWYLLYSTFSERFETHYRMSKSLNGPWIAPVEDTFDARSFYAAKTAECRGKRIAFAWIPTKLGDSDFGRWEWGGNFIAHQLVQADDGTLFVKPIPELVSKFQTELPIKMVSSDGKALWENGCCHISAVDRTAYGTFHGLPKQSLLEADITFSKEIRNFGVAIHQSSDLSNGYFFRIEPFYNRVVFDLWPRCSPGVNQWYIDGDKPFQIESERGIRLTGKNLVHVKLVIDDDICVFYVNDQAAMSMRTYQLNSEIWSFFAQDGTITVSNIHLKTL